MKRYGATPRHRDAVGGVDPGHPRGITGQMIQMQGPFYEDVVGVGFPHPNPMSFELAVTQAESVAQVRLEYNNILNKSPFVLLYRIVYWWCTLLKVTRPSKYDDQPVWMHPFLFCSESDKNAMFKPGAALILEYYPAPSRLLMLYRLHHSYNAFIFVFFQLRAASSGNEDELLVTQWFNWRRTSTSNFFFPTTGRATGWRALQSTYVYNRFTTIELSFIYILQNTV